MVSKMSASIALTGALLGLCLGSVSARGAADYPTTAVADYVYACMKSNGETREALERCSCSIDVVASIVSYDDYVAAETFRRMALTTGEAAGLFKESAPAKAAGAELKRAQAEAEIRCF